jgi:hypothetical protein
MLTSPVAKLTTRADLLLNAHMMELLGIKAEEEIQLEVHASASELTASALTIRKVPTRVIARGPSAPADQLSL